MSHKTEGHDIVVHSGGSGGPSWLTWTNFFVALGVIFFLSTGMPRIWAFAARDSYKAAQPGIDAAIDQTKELLPGVPGVSFKIGDWTYQNEGLAAGKAWTELTGITYGNGGSGNTNGDNGQGDTAPGSDDLPANPPPADADPAALYDKYQAQFVKLVGGIEPDQPDYTLVTETNVKTARQLLANMKATNIDLVAPSTWSEALEAAVQANFEKCFEQQDLSCVRKWNDVQSKVVTDPPGLAEWLKAIMSNGDEVNALLKAAGNTNAEAILNGILNDAFAKAKVERIMLGCSKVGTDKPLDATTALDVQWCLAGKTVTLWVEETTTVGNFIPKDFGGGWGAFGGGDVLSFIDGQTIYRVSYKVANALFPKADMNIHNTQYKFPEQPTLWDPTTNPWSPGQPIP